MRGRTVKLVKMGVMVAISVALVYPIPNLPGSCIPGI